MNRMNRLRNQCGLLDGRPAVVKVCGIRICAEHVLIIRAIAADAGVPIDEEMITGKTRTLKKRRAIAASRRSA